MKAYKRSRDIELHSFLTSALCGDKYEKYTRIYDSTIHRELHNL
jgi:hypothetical protein